LSEYNELDASKIVYVDESGVEEQLQRQHARSLRGKPVFAEKKGKRCRRANIIAGLLNHQLIAPCVFNGYVNADCFNYWLEHHLLKELPQGQVIIIDNASFHKSAKTRELIEKAQCRLVFLPPYSPDLNPIENCWAIIKARLKKIGKQFDNFDRALNQVLSVYL
jgi:transposase